MIYGVVTVHIETPQLYLMTFYSITRRKFDADVTLKVTKG